MNLNEAIEKEQLEKDRKKLVNRSKDKKISENDISLIYKYTEKIKKEFGI